MKFKLIMFSVFFLTISSRASEQFLDGIEASQKIRDVFSDFEQTLKEFQGDDEKLNNFLRIQNTDTEVINNLINCIKHTISYKILKDEITKTLTIITKDTLGQEQDNNVDKIIITIIKEEKVLKFFGILLQRYENHIKDHFPNSYKNKGISFFCLSIINNIINNIIEDKNKDITNKKKEKISPLKWMSRENIPPKDTTNLNLANIIAISKDLQKLASSEILDPKNNKEKNWLLLIDKLGLNKTETQAPTPLQN